MTAPAATDHTRESDALLTAYARLRAIGRRHREQLAKLAETERNTQRADDHDESTAPASDRAA
jgi:hypothetical protein